MHNKEAIINFVSRFHNQIQILSNTTINTNDMPTVKELATFFLDKLCANDNIVGDVRHVSHRIAERSSTGQTVDSH